MNAPLNPPRNVTLPQNRSSIVTVLDIGSSKICCVIAKLKPLAKPLSLPGRSHTVELMGIGHQVSNGVKCGVIVDMDAVEQGVRFAVDAAERMAGLTVDTVIANVSCGRVRSHAFRAAADIEGRQVAERDIQKVLNAARRHLAADDRYVVHSIPIGYTLDGNRGVRDPRGMIGQELGVDVHVVSADPAPLRNLSLCLNRCHLEVGALVASPYASGLSSLVPDETDLGVLLVDMGGGTTSSAIFHDGGFVYADVVAMGGRHVTTDIARGLSTTMIEAERIKVLFGSALACDSDDREVISVPWVGDEDAGSVNEIPRSMLTGIIQPRIAETLELVRDRLKDSGFAGYAGKQAVLVGGASQLAGVRELAQQILGKQVRIGRPLEIKGMPAATSGPAFAAVGGLLFYPQIEDAEAADFLDFSPRKPVPAGYLARMGQWVRESF